MAKKVPAPSAAGKKPGKRKKAVSAAEDMSGASTDPLQLSPVEARYIGDQLRGIAYLTKKLALAIREKNSITPFNPAQLDQMSVAFYSLAAELRGAGDDGSNGG